MYLHRFRSVASTAALAASAAAALLGTPPASAAPGDLVGGTQSTCFWNYGAVGDGNQSYNVAYPDAGAVYWAAYYRRPAGSTLKLKGTFPHARYTSLISYDAAGQIVDGLGDYQYDPDAGSLNPFRPGGDRTAADAYRHYTVTVLSQKNLNPATGQPLYNRNPKNDELPRNNLYATPNTPNVEVVAGQTYALELVLLRTYVPDEGADFNGNVPLPEPELTLANGTKLTGQAACDAIDSESKDRLANGKPVRLPDPTSLLINTAAYQALRHPETLAQACNVFAPVGCPVAPFPANALVQIPRAVDDALTFPATATANWRSQYDRRYLLQLWTGDTAPGANLNPVRSGGGGFFPNLHNNYTRDALNRNFGKVVVLRGKLPTSPKTRGGESTWPVGNFQTRYTSFCMNESVRSTKVMDCAYDEEIPTDSQGWYTVVISRSEDRPSNSGQSCGRSWIEWKPSGDGEDPPLTDADFGWLQIRNMLPDPTFNEAIQNTAHPGDEKAVMGDYLPNVTYMSQADVENGGCKFQVLQPIDQNGSSGFKFGQTIPVRFHLEDAAGHPMSGAIAKLDVAPVSNGIEGKFVGATSTSGADADNVFRPSGSGNYLYNLSTKSLGVGTWVLRVTFKDGLAYRSRISLRQ